MRLILLVLTSCVVVMAIAAEPVSLPTRLAGVLASRVTPMAAVGAHLTILRPFGQNLFDRALYCYDRAAIYHPFLTPETPVAFVLLEPEPR
mgnify:CR=1 FL=1